MQLLSFLFILLSEGKICDILLEGKYEPPPWISQLVRYWWPLPFREGLLTGKDEIDKSMLSQGILFSFLLFYPGKPFNHCFAYVFFLNIIIGGWNSLLLVIHISKYVVGFGYNFPPPCNTYLYQPNYLQLKMFTNTRDICCK